MIVVKLIGGLGNQMFQYATARKLSQKKYAKLKFDTNGLSLESTPREYSLGVFNIQESFASLEEIESLKNWQDDYISLILKKIGFFPKIFTKKTFIVEKSFRFDPEILDLKDNVYLQGYWQTEKYFEDVENVIRREFTLKEEYSIENKEITKEIKNSNAVSVHVRRGDYAKDQKTNKFHGLCPIDYYNDAIKKIAKKIEKPIFYVFSDDIDWVKKNLKFNYPVRYVSNGILKDYEELMLMSYCKHNIIANSSFSWWGAWLNSNPEKIVIAPKKWFNDPNVDTSDLIPENWIRI